MITGNEPVYPFLKYNTDGNGQAIVVRDFATGSVMFLPYEKGESLRQKTLREFMCAYVTAVYSNPDSYKSFVGAGKDAKFSGSLGDFIADQAAHLTDIYIKKLNETHDSASPV